MCGITGIFQFDGTPVSEQELLQMNEYNAQRGPDSSGIWAEGEAGLAHRRLSIIDLSEKGHQPMENTGGNAVISFNGEIYNYEKLRDDLLKAGFSFKSHSDTEVILNGYQCWGIDKLLAQLDGMFAFVLYDKAKKTAFACRDCFGKKPLYYFSNAKRFSFASDIRSIWRTTPDLNLDFNSLDYYLSELSSPQPHSIWKEIHQVRPGYYLIISLIDQKISEHKYWQSTPAKIEFANEEDLLNKVENSLVKAIMKRTIGDVPVVAFLSGGVDSGLIVALLAMHSTEKVRTFSMGVNFDPHNELADAKKLAKRYDTDHRELIVEADILQTLPELIEGFGEPFADSSNIPTYLLTREMRSFAKVALSGDGGDEAFGGYYEYNWAWMTDDYLQEFPDGSFSDAKVLQSKILHRFGLTKTNLGHLKHYSQLSGGKKLFRGMGFSSEEKLRLYNSESSSGKNDFTTHYLDRIWENNKTGTLLDSMFRASFDTRLVNDYLVKVDRASMMNSLEVRSPFLDKDLVELSFSIPGTIKLKNGIQKYLLKKLGEKYIDPAIFSRNKTGFGIPLNNWLRKELRSFSEEIIFSGALAKRNLFDMKYIRRLVDEHHSAKKDHAHKIWAILCLELWFQKFYDRKK